MHFDVIDACFLNVIAFATCCRSPVSSVRYCVEGRTLARYSVLLVERRKHHFKVGVVHAWTFLGRSVARS